MKIQKSTFIICLLVLLNGLSFASDINVHPPVIIKDSKTENLLLTFNNKYLKGYNYKQKIEYPGDIQNQQDPYYLVVNAGMDQAIILFINDDKTNAKLINLQDYAYELAIKAANSMLSKSSSLKVYSRDISTQVPGVKSETKISVVYNKKNEIEQILKSSIILDYCRRLGSDFDKIQKSINLLSSEETKNYYQGYLAVMLERSAQIAAYRQAIEKHSNTNLGPALDNAINNSIPGVIQSNSVPTDKDLTRTVNKYIKADISSNQFNSKIDQIISARLEKATQGNVQSYQVKAVKFQVDFLLNEIKKERDILNKYGGGKYMEEGHTYTTFNSIAKNISSDSQKAALTNVSKIPVDLAALIATLPSFIETSQFEIQINEIEFQTENEAEVKNQEVEVADTLQKEVPVLIAASVEAHKEEVITEIEEKNEVEVIAPPVKEAPVEKENEISVADLNSSLEKAVSRGDGQKIIELVKLGATPDIISPYGGNIMHSMADKIKDDKVVEFIGKKGISLNKLDSKGNAPLHYAIMLGNNDYAEGLIKNGANVDLLNSQGLAPLHLTAYLDNIKISKALLASGVNLNLQGNKGYSPLHIVSEMNNFDMTKLLLLDGVDKKLKTGQHISPKAIVKIQGTKEIKKLLKTNGSYNNEFAETKTNNSLVVRDSDNYPEIKFNLPYDDYLLSKRKTWTTVKWVSIPVFIVSAAATAYLHIEANDYHSKYQEAITEDDARYYYDQTRQYDTYSYITGGVAVVSLYFTIHSSVKKSKIERQLRKVYPIH